MRRNENGTPLAFHVCGVRLRVRITVGQLLTVRTSCLHVEEKRKWHVFGMCCEGIEQCFVKLFQRTSLGWVTQQRNVG